MRMVDPAAGRTYVSKRRRRFNAAGEPRELTFTCYRGYPFLLRDRTRFWLKEALDRARTTFGFQLWAYVIMPEHVHLLVIPPTTSTALADGAGPVGGTSPPPSKTKGVPPSAGSKARVEACGDEEMARFLQAVKEPVGRKAIAHLRDTGSPWLERLRVPEGKRVRHRFWQPGGGYDRNVKQTRTLRSMIEYLHANPVRRGLVATPEDWEWSSARWFAGLRPVPIEMDGAVLAELQRE